jgi:ferredoxin
MTVPSSLQQQLRVWIDQDLCTGDGLCAQYSREVFELDVDGLAYVKEGRDGDLLTAPGAAATVPVASVQEVIDSAKECPGNCIHVERVDDGVAVAGPAAPEQ